jgi:hypothetical protein
MKQKPGMVAASADRYIRSPSSPAPTGAVLMSYQNLLREHLSRIVRGSDDALGKARLFVKRLRALQ